MKSTVSPFQTKAIDKSILISKLDDIFIAKTGKEFTDGFIELFADIFDIPRDKLESIDQNPDKAKKARTLLRNYFERLDEKLEKTYQIECGHLLTEFAYKEHAKAAFRRLVTHILNNGKSEEDLAFLVPKTGGKLLKEQEEEIRREQERVINLFDEMTNNIGDLTLESEAFNYYIDHYNQTASQLMVVTYILGEAHIEAPSIIYNNYNITLKDIISHLAITFFKHSLNRFFIRKCQLNSCQKYFIQPHTGRDNRFCPDDSCRVIASRERASI